MLALAVVCLFSSCGKPEPRQREAAAPTELSGLYEINCRGFAFTAEIRAQPSHVEIAFTAPPELDGCTVSCSSREFRYDMCGVTSVRRSEDAPVSSVPSLLYPVLSSLLSGDGKLRENGKTREYETGSAIAVLDGDGVQAFSDRSGAVKAVRASK